MAWGLKINNIPLNLGQKIPAEALDAAEVRKAGLLRRVFAQQPLDQTVYDIENCELSDLEDDLHIYPCTHSYLNQDRQWRTKATLFLKHDRLQRILFQVVEGQTAAMNFLERFEAAASKALGSSASR